MATISRQAYAEMFGPTTGDRMRLGDTELFIGNRSLPPWIQRMKHATIDDVNRDNQSFQKPPD